MLVSHRYNFIYLKARKVAGTSVESFLQRYCLSPENEKNFIIAHDTDFTKSEYGIISGRMKGKENWNWYNHKEPIELRQQLGDNIWNNYIKICSVRNPYDMMVSWFHFMTGYQGLKKEKFTIFVKNIQSHSLILKNKNIWSEDGEFNFRYIRFENMEEDLKTIMNELNLPDYQVELPHFKKSNRAEWRDYYTIETKNIVYKLFEKEINHFNYEF